MGDILRQNQSVTRPRGEVIRLLRASGLVDADWYRRTYRDVAEAGLDPVEHYIDHGAAERRNPNAYFDTSWYMATYPDIGEAGLNPLIHYLIDGASEGRRASRMFDTKYYLSDNPDVAASGLNPLVHYLRSGLREGRPCRSYPFGSGRRG